jgi:hypothetical protein
VCELRPANSNKICRRLPRSQSKCCVGTQIPRRTACLTYSRPKVTTFSSLCNPSNTKLGPNAHFLSYAAHPIYTPPNTLPSLLPNVLPCLQPTVTRRPSGHCMRPFRAVSFVPNPHNKHNLSIRSFSFSFSLSF